MADKKISELNSVSLPLAGTEVIPIVQGGETKKVSIIDLGGVTSVTGDSVDNTNPLTPIINAIPLSGTTIGNKVTGSIEFGNEENFLTSTDGVNTSTVKITNYGVVGFESGIDGATSSFNLVDGKAVYSNNDVLSKGLSGEQDFSENITDLDYTQKIYVDNSLNNKLSNDISDYTTASLPLSDTDKLLVNQGGTFKEVAKSELASTDSFMLYFRTGSKTWVLNTWYQQFSQNGFNISGTATYGTASIPDSSIQLNGSFLMIPSGYIIEEVTFSVQYIGSSLASAYANEIYITRGEPIGGYQSGSQSQTNVEILAQESVTITPTTGNANLKFFKKLTIASHVSKTLSVLQVSMREKNINNGVYDAYLYFKFKKA